MALLAGGAPALILFARHLRGGVTDFTDAFFPLTRLNFGHSVDVLFPFRITFVLSLGFIMAAGCPLFLRTSISFRLAASIAGGALLLLPVSPSLLVGKVRIRLGTLLPGDRDCRADPIFTYEWRDADTSTAPSLVNVAGATDESIDPGANGRCGPDVEPTDYHVSGRV